MKNVIVRSLTGIIYIGVIVAAIMGGDIWMYLLTMIFTLLAVDEFNRISDSNHLPFVLRIIDLLGAGFMTLIVFAVGMNDFDNLEVMMIIYLLYLFARFIMPLYIKTGNQLSMTAHSLMGQLYIALPLSLMMGAYFLSPAMVMLMFIMIWLNDTGAFCVGSLIGKHRLFERISPKKSWEGFFGGLFFAIAAGVIAALWFGTCGFNQYPLWAMALFGAVVSVMSTWGDLVESMIKRTLGIKDSGKLLPGHGGILDRIDSLLLVAPATLLFIILIQKYL